jgi:hypothetical protein
MLQDNPSGNDHVFIVIGTGVVVVVVLVVVVVFGPLTDPNIPG